MSAHPKDRVYITDGKDPLNSLIKNGLRAPEDVAAFGEGAWVYSEIAARSMIYEAYWKGHEDAARQTSQQKSSVGRETKHSHPITGE